MKRILAPLISLGLVVSVLSACSPSGPKVTQVEDEPIEITIRRWMPDHSLQEAILQDGTYTGQMIDGVANGEGSYTRTDADGKLWTYSGGFKDGFFDGYGEIIWSNGTVQRGDYIKGAYLPTQSQALYSVIASKFPSCHISDGNMEFIEANEALFPALTEDALAKSAELVKPDLTYQQMTKSMQGLDGVLYSCPLAGCFDVKEVPEYGYEITYIYAMDDFGNIYVIVYPGTLPDVFSETFISFTGLPIQPIQYENVGGGVTNAIVVLGSSVSITSY